ncbi:MAG TPA: lasso RiPP family leader peptide-containing protein [Acidimicrobiales bacterium]|nr:lasso RiPP family leader peptide-containing protein [Acidimicrobiales bacterium]
MAKYESPRLESVGTLQDLTLQRHKYYNQNSDFIFPDNLRFNFSGSMTPPGP